MKKVQISLDSINKVKSFVNTIAQQPGEFDLSSDRYVVDAKSIMGIFSLDLSKNLCLEIHNEAEFDNIIAALKEFIVE
ncbi:MAG: HPr family phosphocarrier protein [Clostridiales bacterium]|nr:HPr family phosphocarrier protein [Clostridiales bacterium]